MLDAYYIAFEGYTYGADKFFTKEILEQILDMVSDDSCDIDWFYDVKKDSFIIIDGFNNEFEIIKGFEFNYEGNSCKGYRICSDWSWEELSESDHKCEVIKVTDISKSVKL